MQDAGENHTAVNVYVNRQMYIGIRNSESEHVKNLGKSFQKCSEVAFNWRGHECKCDDSHLFHNVLRSEENHR